MQRLSLAPLVLILWIVVCGNVFAQADNTQDYLAIANAVCGSMKITGPAESMRLFQIHVAINNCEIIYAFGEDPRVETDLLSDDQGDVRGDWAFVVVQAINNNGKPASDEIPCLLKCVKGQWIVVAFDYGEGISQADLIKFGLPSDIENDFGIVPREDIDFG